MKYIIHTLIGIIFSCLFFYVSGLSFVALQGFNGTPVLMDINLLKISGLFILFCGSSLLTLAVTINTLLLPAYGTIWQDVISDLIL